MAGLGVRDADIGLVVDGIHAHGIAERIGTDVVRRYTDGSGACFDVIEESDGTGALGAFLQTDRGCALEAVALVGDGRLWRLRVGADSVEPYDVCARVDRLLVMPGPTTVSLTGVADEVSSWQDVATYLGSREGLSVMAPESLVPYGLDRPDPPGPYALVTGVVEAIDWRENSLTEDEFAVVTVRSWGITLPVAVSDEDAEDLAVGGVIQADCLLVASPVAAVSPDVAAHWTTLDVLADDVVGHLATRERLLMLQLDDERGTSLVSHPLDAHLSPQRIALPSHPSSWSASENWIAVSFDDRLLVLDHDLRAIHSRPAGADDLPVTAVAAGTTCVWLERRRTVESPAPVTRTRVMIEQLVPDTGERQVHDLGVLQSLGMHGANHSSLRLAGPAGRDAATIQPTMVRDSLRQLVLRIDGEGGLHRAEWEGPPWLRERRHLPKAPGALDDVVEVEVLDDGLLVDGAWAVHHGHQSPYPHTGLVDEGLLVCWKLEDLVVVLVRGRTHRRFEVQGRGQAQLSGRASDRWMSCSSFVPGTPSVLARLRGGELEHVAVLPQGTAVVAVRPDALVVAEDTGDLHHPDRGRIHAGELDLDETAHPVRRLRLVPRLKNS